jgi:uncharacterized membrane protein YcaP (DUF421 family)
MNNNQPSEVWDWNRLLVGDVPAAFLLEVAFRMTMSYLVLLICMRLLGKRMAAQLTRNELAAVTSLAAGVGLPVVAPDRGMLPALMISIIVVIVIRTLSNRSAINEKFEAVTQGSLSTLLADGVMNVRNMERTGISRERVLAQLRSRELHQLGQVKSLFFEANGNFTLIRAKDPSPGLCALPDDDNAYRNEFKIVAEEVCHVCGNGKEKVSEKLKKCDNCGSISWVKAML